MRRLLISSLLLLMAASGVAAQPKSIGIVTLERYERSDSLTFLNEDGSVWLSFDPYYRENESSFSVPDGFGPMSFHPDYFTLALRCVSVKDSLAAVVIDEQTGTIKYADVGSQTLEFQTWEDHLTGLFAIGLRDRTPPARAEPDSTAEIVDVYSSMDYRLKPAEVRGDWLRVEIQPAHGSEEEDARSGWIRWRDDQDQLLITLFYFS